MTDNPYQAPKSDPVVPMPDDRLQFYVVSKLKFTLLYFATIGLYGYFWIFINWHRHKKVTGIPGWPIMRGLFPIFFIYPLATAIDERLKSKNNTHKWDPAKWATLFILTGIGRAILSVLNYSYFGDTDSSIANYEIYSSIIDNLVMLLDYFIYLQLLRAVNAGHDDPAGSMNNQFTWLNYFWILLGVIVWTLTIAFLFDLLGWIDVDAFLDKLETQ